MPTYQANIPKPTDFIPNSQDDILQNFQVLNSFVVGQYDIPVSASAPAFPAGDIGLFNLLYATTGRNELFVNQSNGTQIPITAARLLAAGFTELASGLLIKWGVASIPLVGANAINLNIAGTPNFATAFWAGFSFGGVVPNPATATITTIVPTTLTITCSQPNLSVYWMVLGTGV